MTFGLIGVMCVSALALNAHPAPPAATITIQANQKGVDVSPLLWGIFYEEINHAGDGGIYAEMVQNRAFEETQPAAGATMKDGQMVTPNGFTHPIWYKSDLHAWSVVADGGARVTASLDTAEPLNEKTPHSMRVEVADCGKRAAVANEGYWGMSVKAGEAYSLSFYARCPGAPNSVTATLEAADGSATYARAAVAGVSGGWKRYSCTLKAAGTDPKARLVLSFGKPGTVWLDVVSLFPRKTFRNRPNGLRPDLAGLLQGLRPGFVRFPGGCVVEGCTIANRIQWKNTIGDIAQRPGRWNLWGYHNTEGLGFHEYLQLCEDLGAEPLYVCNAGMSCFYRNAEIEKDPEKLQPYVQDMLDALEYANGPATSKWGAERARNGHPAPFNIRYVEIGNENWGEDYFRAYRIFYDALKRAYPDVTAIADCPIPNAPVEVVDEHYYVAPGWFFANAHKYDTYDRSGPRIYVGEYACNSQVGAGNMLAALSEAAWMTGMERNSDIVTMASYAPLFENVNNRAWPVNLIQFDSSRSLGRSSYQVQKLFAANRPDHTLPIEVAAAPTGEQPAGAIGLGAWLTQVEYKDATVMRGGQTLYSSDFAAGLSGWKSLGGQWSVADGVLHQSSESENCLTTAGDAAWTDYTFSVKARKVAGAEGFLILFHVRNADNWVWWNIGGWGNSRHALEQSRDGAKSEVGRSVRGSVETGRWYDIRVETQGSKVRCYLDGKPVQSADLSQSERLYATAGRDLKKGQIVVKVVNPTGDALATDVVLTGVRKVASRAEVITVSATSPQDENTLEQPTKIAPVASRFDGASNRFRFTFRPYSVTVLRLTERR